MMCRVSANATRATASTFFHLFVVNNHVAVEVTRDLEFSRKQEVQQGGRSHVPCHQLLENSTCKSTCKSTWSLLSVDILQSTWQSA